jgi:hypothetical protein
VTYNGHRGYSSYDGANAQPAGGDYYQLTFGRKVRLREVTFYEGEYVGGINSFLPDDVPKGGFFTDLMVEIGNQGTFTPVSNLQFSEALDSWLFYQVIDLTFDPADGDAVWIRGTAGGSQEFTTIVELEAYGAIFQPGDANLDGRVDGGDMALIGGTWMQQTGATWEDGDFNGDGKADGSDLSLMGGNWMWSAPSAPGPSPFDAPGELPEPGGLSLLVGVWPFLLGRRTAAPKSWRRGVPRVLMAG